MFSTPTKPRLKLTAPQKRQLERIGRGAPPKGRANGKSLEVLERLGLIQRDLITGQLCLTQDGREHLWG
jgi:hypothetical protein